MSLTRRLIKTMGVFAGVQASGIACSVLRAKMIALWIGPAGVGLNALLTNASMMLSQLSQLGINVSGVREIASAPPGDHRRRIIGAVLRWSLLLGLIGGSGTLLVAPLLSLFNFGDWSHSWMFVLVAVAVLSSVISAGRQAVLQGTENLSRLARLLMYSVLTSTVVSIPLYWWLRIGSIPWVVMIFAVVPAVYYMCDANIRAAGLPTEGRESRHLAASFLRLGAVLTVSGMLTMSSGYILTVFLNHEANMSEVGIYQAGYSIIANYLGVLVTAMSVGYYPLLSSQAAHPWRQSVLVSRQVWLICCMLLLFVPVFLMCRHLIVWLLYSSEFYAVIPYLTLAIGGGALRLISNSVATIMLARGDSRAYMASEIGSTLVGLTLNIAGYMLWGIPGMGAAYTVWFALYTVAVWVLARRRYGLRVNRRVTVLVLTTVMATAAFITAAIWHEGLNLY